MFQTTNQIVSCYPCTPSGCSQEVIIFVAACRAGAADGQTHLSHHCHRVFWYYPDSYLTQHDAYGIGKQVNILKYFIIFQGFQEYRLGVVAKTTTGWWLSPTPLNKYKFVSWDDDIPIIWKNIPNNSIPPTSYVTQQRAYRNMQIFPNGFSQLVDVILLRN